MVYPDIDMIVWQTDRLRDKITQMIAVTLRLRSAVRVNHDKTQKFQ